MKKRLPIFLFLLPLSVSCVFSAERASSRTDLNILLNLPESKDTIPTAPVRPKTAAAKEDSAKTLKGAIDLSSPAYQKGLLLYKQALQEYLNGDYSKAADLFRQVMEIDPLHKNAFEYLNKAKNAIDNRSDPDKMIEQAGEKRNLRNELVFQSGLEAYVNGEYAEAVRIWRNLISEAPDYKKAFQYIQEAEGKLDAIALNFLEQGLYYFRNGDTQQALIEWENGLSHCPGNNRLQRQIDLVARRQEERIRQIIAQAENSMKADRAEEAYRLYQEALTEFPDTKILAEGLAEVEKKSRKSLQKRFDKAKKAFDDGDLQAARTEFNTLAAWKWNEAAVRDYLTRLQNKLKEQEERSLLDTLFQEGVHSLEKGRMDEALGSFRTIEKQQPDFPGLADKLRTAEEGVRAKEKRKASVEAFNKGLTDFNRGLYHSALKTWRSVLADNPQNEAVKKYIVETEALLKDTERQKTEENQRNTALEINREAVGLFKEKKYKEAGQLLDSALSLDPDNETIRKGVKAVRKERLREEDQQIPVSEKEIENLFHRGITLYRNGDYKKAIECWRKIIALQPDHDKAQKYIDNVSKKLEKIERI